MDNAPQLQQVQLNLLATDPSQPRKHFDEDALNSLADSIKARGLIQPIVVIPRTGLDASNAGTKDYDYRIIAGERRYRAAKLAGIQDVPVIVRNDLQHTDVAVLQILENMQREDLTLAETCAGVATLVEQMGFAKTCEQLGKSEAWVSKHAGVMRLPDAIKKLVGEGKIESVDVAKELATLVEIAPKKAAEMMARIDPSATLHHAQPEPQQDDDAGDDDEDPEEAEWENSHWIDGKHVKNADLTDEQRERIELRGAKYQPKAITRSEIRLEVLEAKADLQKKEEQKAAKKAEREALKTDPTAAKKASAEKNKKDREKAHAQACKLASEQCEALSHELTIKLNVAAGFRAPRRGKYHWEGEAPRIIVGSQHYSHYSKAKPPASAETAKYIVGGSGTFDEVDTIAKLIEREPKLDVRFSGHVTLIEAKKLAAVLGSRVRFSMQVERIGTQLQALAQPAVASAITKANDGAGDDPHGIAAFLKARVKKSTIPARRIKSGDLHAEYVSWCKAEELVPVQLRHNAWAQTIEAAGIERIRSDGMHYIGVELVKS